MEIIIFDEFCFEDLVDTLYLSKSETDPLVFLQAAVNK